MKSLNIVLAGLIFISTSFATSSIQNSQISKVCLGEFTESIVESVKSCTSRDLNQAQVEVYDLEAGLVSLNEKIVEAQKYIDSGKFKSDETKERVLMVSAIGGAALGMAAMIYGQAKNMSTLSGAGFVVTALLTWGVIYGRAKMNMTYIKYDPAQLGKMKTQVESILEQVRIRKALLETANAIKAAQTASSSN